MEALAPLGDYSGTVGLTLIALMVISRRLVWYTDLRRAEARADHWQEVALKALGVSEKVVTTAEQAVSRGGPGGGGQ